MNSATRLKSLALALAQLALHRRGQVVHESRSGVEYIIPFSRCTRYIQPGKPTSDGCVYVKAQPSKLAKRGNLVLSDRAA